MAQSLSPECTPLKHEYDLCFNAWFEGYLKPAVASAEPLAASVEKREAYSKRQAEEFQAKCGKIWESYRNCIQNAVKEKGLDKLLQQARDENPLAEPPPPPPSPNSSSS